MLIDFCHHSVKAKIKADKVSFDGYEVQNLVSGNAENKRKGFLSDHFIKPPVNVTVQFPCNICIYSIVLDPVIGQQKSCDLKIFTATERMTDSWLYSSQSDTKIKTDGVLFNFVGSETLNDPTVICFINKQFKERNSWRVVNVPDLNSYPCVSQLNSRKLGGLYSASHVTICLNRSKGGKSVALKRLEIWGIPAVKVPAPIQNILRNAFSAATEEKVIIPKNLPHKVAKISELRSDTNTDKAYSERSRVLIDGVLIPDDFIDQITFDLMTVPILLPCGKNIDQSTLDRFVNTEASWGRPPSDPFTSVVFTTSSGPISNTGLKARIDNFVLKHSNSLNVPQTLGHSSVQRIKKCQIMPSKLISDNHPVKPTSRYSMPDSPQISGCNYPNSDNSSTSLGSNSLPDAIKSQTKLPLSKDTCLNLETSAIMHCKRKHFDDTLKSTNVNKCLNTTEDDSCVDLTNDNETVTIKKQKMNSADHDSDLTQSLDEALLSTLGSLPSFTKKKQPTAASKNGDNSCCKCKLNLTKSDIIKYKIVCGHLICRLCLVQESSSVKCNVCLTQCRPSDAVRMF